jgi:tetratricopeptide (TPR) repeat protein
VFYAGHGIQYQGENFLIPVKADIKGPKDLAYAAVNAQWIMDTIGECDGSLNIFVLDACRNYPGNWSRGSSRGLAVMSVNCPQSIVMYATGANEEASDNPSGRNGLFTSELLKNLSMRDLDIDQVFKRTMAGVNKASNGEQAPYMYTNFTGTALLGEKDIMPTVVQPESPLSVEEYVAIGKQLAVQRQFSLALEYFDKARDLDYWGFWNYYHYLGMAILADACGASAVAPDFNGFTPKFNYFSELDISDKGRITEAIECFRCTTYGGRSFYEGLANMALSAYSSAIDCFTKDIEWSVYDSKSYCLRGLCYKAKNELDKAMADYTKAIQEDPKSFFAYKLRGEIFSQKGNLDLAIKDYTQAIQLKPDYAQAYFSRGVANHKQYMTSSDSGTKALYDYSLAISLDPECDEAWYARGMLYSSYPNGYDRAVSDLQEAIKYNPENGLYKDALHNLENRKR